MDFSQYKVSTPINLTEIPTHFVIDNAKKKLRKLRKKIGDLQDTMYAEGKHAALICLQGMDTSGKDSLVREVFKDVNSRGVEVHSFKVPTELELKHDFLWRHYAALPEKGRIGVFNRKHYENVLVTNGTIVLKFYLHLSKKEQKNRLLSRLNLPQKNWKFSKGDLKERKLWDSYMEYYEDAINRISKENAPWYVIPADDKDMCRLLRASILHEELLKYNFQEPTLPEDVLSEQDNFKAQLNEEK